VWLPFFHQLVFNGKSLPAIQLLAPPRPNPHFNSNLTSSKTTNRARDKNNRQTTTITIETDDGRMGVLCHYTYVLPMRLVADNAAAKFHS
jgi:hypothetical protein